MSTAAASSSPSLSSTQQISAKGHIGLVVLASIAAGLALGLMLVLGVFAGADEPRIIGSALLALGAGFALLATASSRQLRRPAATNASTSAHCFTGANDPGKSWAKVFAGRACP